MLKAVGYNIRGTLSVLGYFLNTVFWFVPIFILSLFKLIPITLWRRIISYPLDACATAWISVNNCNQRLFSRTQFSTTGLEALTPHDWYLVIANHQSWVDILVLQRTFNRKIPFLKFFLKKELIWVPILGLAWWALEFPFMQRHSKSFLAKNPHLKGKDMETTRKACAKFKYKPVSIMNFVEGTRFTQIKHDKQRSPFIHLLKPKAGGIAFVLSAMGEQLHKLIDVTIDYPDGVPSYWDFVCGKVKTIRVEVTVTPIQTIMQEGFFSTHYFTDPAQKARFQQWLNARWKEKDDKLTALNSTQAPL
ncbi:acyltransferase [Alteromonas sp. C1M14]|uniref:acyltransferase n=1 Tax=Alteromonas sp. C1M14 TaxID=2841567 RepID=UPI001C0861D8|nr:acyltransferase [Alteromonas sp. C1M14]MBU2976625.1 acyltransferase [Alteromonas sp. C1M14]